MPFCASSEWQFILFKSTAFFTPLSGPAPKFSVDLGPKFSVDLDPIMARRPDVSTICGLEFGYEQQPTDGEAFYRNAPGFFFVATQAPWDRINYSGLDECKYIPMWSNLLQGTAPFTEASKTRPVTGGSDRCPYFRFVLDARRPFVRCISGHSLLTPGASGQRKFRLGLVRWISCCRSFQ